eukprot:CAMPEP_0172183106 /NCGR_PEP_ID=MMETSP1050-20130122/18790_1 /TAXON_ID=233186 /ORGANISM="Cryptomonas curvata, Strain CCAP979/52" /LENGTH=70 /DNA_ID=CAMNT_0012856665 /DNA_START=85 /DNA_END=297 /DNA_ORIENTATION=+
MARAGIEERLAPQAATICVGDVVDPGARAQRHGELQLGRLCWSTRASVGSEWAPAAGDEVGQGLDSRDKY